MTDQRKRWYDNPHLYTIVVAAIIWCTLVGVLIYAAARM
jgi:hypothetical protein